MSGAAVPSGRVRPATAADRAEWLRMLGALHPELPADVHVPDVDAFITGATYNELLPSVVLVWDRGDGRLGGLLELAEREYAEGCSGTTPYVESWYVDPDLRQHGVGRALMNAAEEWSRGHGYAVLASDAVVTNDLSHRAHKAVGFSEVERIVIFRKSL